MLVFLTDFLDMLLPSSLQVNACGPGGWEAYLQCRSWLLILVSYLTCICIWYIYVYVRIFMYIYKYVCKNICIDYVCRYVYVSLYIYANIDV